MQIYKFDCNGHNAPAYGCNKPGDNSGEYVKVDDLAGLQQNKSGCVCRFDEEKPLEQTWFAFIDPEEPDRWETGWMDMGKIRVEGGSSYKPEELTIWYPLPDPNIVYKNCRNPRITIGKKKNLTDGGNDENTCT